MSRTTKEILDLIAARDHYDGARRALENAMWEVREKCNPQPGEAWLVLLPWDRDVREVITAIKTGTGWVGYFGDCDINEGCRPESAVIPIERVAEAPIITGDTE